MDALRARCHCGTAQFLFTIQHEGLAAPLKASLCHCEDCRRTTGSLLGTWAVLPVDPPDFSALTEYRSSQNLVRYFCTRCGASVSNVEAAEWDLALGLVEVLPSALLDRVQMFVESTQDGGCSIWLPRDLYKRPLKRYSRLRDSTEVGNVHLAAIASRVVLSSPEKLRASCHCKAVQFYITRPQGRHTGNKHIGTYDLKRGSCS